MADQNNAPERIWVRVTDKTVMYAKPSDADEFDVEYIRADRAAPEGQPVTLTYTNWRGETAERAITPKRIWFGSTDWHPEPQWLLTAFDAEKQADRDFALKDFGHPALAAPTDNTALVEEMENLKDRNGKPPLTKEEMARFRELFPLDHLSRVALAAWVNVRPDQLPKEMQAHNCPATMEAWGRVAHAIEAALASREAPPASDSGEKPLCPVCYNRTDAELRAIGGFYSMESNCPECSPRAKERAKQDADREALVRLLQIITRNGSLDDGRTLHEVIADALLARGLRPPACQQEAVTVAEALQDMLQAVCGETGFAACVRKVSGKAYPWPALDLAEAKALRALKGES